MANGFITKKIAAYYVVIKRPEEKLPPKWISVKKELNLDRPAKLKEAQVLLRKKLAEIGELGYMVTTDLTLAQFLEQWLNSKNNIRDSTRDGYETMIRCHVLPDDIAGVKLRKLTPIAMQAFFNRLVESGCGTRTIRYTAMIIKQSLAAAVKWELLSRNPAFDMELPADATPEKKIWDDETAARFLEAIQGDALELFFVVAMSTGMRRGEILGLTWDCVDFDRQTLTINKSLTPKGALTAPKTEKSIRQIKITEGLGDLLKAHQKEQREVLFAIGKRNEHSAVFLTSNGTLYLPGNVLRHFKHICVKHNLPKIDVHSLRHLYVSWMIDSEVDIKTIANQVGHARPGTTLNIYTHLFERQKEKAAKAAADKMSALRGTN
jgi:integrase